MKSLIQKIESGKSIRTLGIMSGTSQDGLDLCLADFSYNKNYWQYNILAAETLPYTSDENDLLTSAFSQGKENILPSTIKFGEIVAKKTNNFLQKRKMQPDLICSHGHTIFHEPAKGYTVQIGEGKTIAKLTGITVVNDFRSLDVSLGGQGAPLVPIGDQELFRNFESCLNLGGFSNISFSNAGKRVAFDISPANLPLNKIMNEAFGKSFDLNGEQAASGKLIPNLLMQLNRLEYYHKTPPKSLGVEWLVAVFYPILDQYSEFKAADLLNTLVEHIAQQIGQTLNGINVSNCLVTGGGVRNVHLLTRIKANTNAKIIVPDNGLIDFKEALIFGFLGVLKILGKVNSLASVTGAKRDSSGGTIHFPD